MSDESNNPFFPPSMDNALKNVTDKPTQNMGTTFADIWYLIFGGISQAAEKRRIKYAHDLEIYQKELSQKINEIPTEKRIEPSIHVTAQALENSKYCISSEELRKMFVNLISGTMNSDIEPRIHPSFPEILKQMGQKDAIFLTELKECAQIPIACIGMQNTPGKDFILMAQDVYVSKNTKLDPYDCSLSIASLSHAGLITTTYTQWFNDPDLYAPIKESVIYLSAKNICESQKNGIYFQKGIARLTNLGSNFVNVCL